MEYRISEKLSVMKPSAIREIFKSLSDPSIIAFAAGNPAAESFPTASLAKISAEIFEKDATTALQYGITEGYPKLRALVEERLSKRFGIDKEKNKLMIVSGGQQGLELLCKTMCDSGDAVICENPTFIGALNAFRSNGARVVGVATEDDGVSLEALENTLKNEPRAKIFYVIPTFHNPKGTTMSYEKREKVYEMCKRYKVLILEDNPYGELRFAGEEVPTIKSMDKDGIVVYCGSFSKILSAGMRVGFVSAPEAVFQKMVVAKQVEDVHTNQFFQMMCAEFMERCDMDGHIRTVCSIYQEKCGLMLSELDKKMPECVKYTRPCGGLFVWLTLPEGADLDLYVKKCLERKVAVVPGTAFDPDGAGGPVTSFRITYSTPTREQIVEGVSVLAEVAREMFEKN